MFDARPITKLPDLSGRSDYARPRPGARCGGPAHSRHRVGRTQPSDARCPFKLGPPTWEPTMIQFYRLSSDENCKIREVTPAGSRQHENRAEAGDYSSRVRHVLYPNTQVNPDSLNARRVRQGWWQVPAGNAEASTVAWAASAYVPISTDIHECSCGSRICGRRYADCGRERPGCPAPSHSAVN